MATAYSAFVLALTAYTSYRIYRTRNDQLAGQDVGETKVWALISFGFLFLALDEEFKIHENIDRAIHKIFNMTQTSLTDRIDDFLILLYGIIGVIILYRSRDEILRIPGFVGFLKLGFYLMVLQVAIDAFTNGQDFVRWLSISEQYVDAVIDWGKVLEEAVKLLAVAALFSGLIHALRYVVESDEQAH